MESDRTDPPLTAADLDEIDAKLKPCTDPPFEVIGTRVSCGISRRGREIVVRADEHDIDDLEALAALRNHAEPLLALARRGLEAEAALEEVSAALDDEEDAHSETLDLLEAAEGRADEAERERDIARGVAEDRTEAALRAKEEYAAALEKVAERVKALESTLAEAAPVVEAAERLEPHIRTLSAYMDGSTACTVEQKGVKILGELRSAVRAARSLRGAGEGGGA